MHTDGKRAVGSFGVVVTGAWEPFHVDVGNWSALTEHEVPLTSEPSLPSCKMYYNSHCKVTILFTQT